MKEFELIKEWAEERNLIEGSNTGAQLLKLYEEFGELAAGIARKDDVLIKDSIGDVVVVLCVLSAQLGRTLRKGPNMSMPEDVNRVMARIGHEIGRLFVITEDKDAQAMMSIHYTMGKIQFLCGLLDVNFEECVRIAYDEIKDRKGRMVDGVFIKEK